jgi:hypothetical protein
MKKEKYITEAVFKSELTKLATKEDLKGFATQDALVRLALVVDQHTTDIAYIKENMSTKNDIRLILDKFDFFAKKVSLFEQEEGVQSLHLNEVRAQVNNHEKRLAALELRSH